MKRNKPRTEWVELEIETDYDLEKPERQYFDAMKGEGHPGSPGGATLTGAWLRIGDKQIDIFDALDEKTRAYMEEARFEELCEVDDGPDWDD